MMTLGGNNRAYAFFKQHGWTEGGIIESKYTSRAAELYRQLLSKEVAESFTEVVEPADAANEHSDGAVAEVLKECFTGEHETSYAKDPSQKVVSSSVKKLSVGKATGKSGGRSIRKLIAKADDSLYDQKSEEKAPEAPTALRTAAVIKVIGSSASSRFEFVENDEPPEISTGGMHKLHCVAPSKSLNSLTEVNYENYGINSEIKRIAKC